MSRPLLLAASALLALGCYKVETRVESKLSSFAVTVTGVFQQSTGAVTPVRVITPCAKKYGTDAQVPAEVRGTQECPYIMPRGPIGMVATVAPLDDRGRQMRVLPYPVSFRVVPGDLATDYSFRTAPTQPVCVAVACASQGDCFEDETCASGACAPSAGSGCALPNGGQGVYRGAATAALIAQHVYGRTQVWAEDAPPEPIYDGGVVELGGLPAEQFDPKNRTFAAGLSQVIYFEEPTIANVQLPDGFDNTTSPLIGQFLTIGRPPENGQQLVQSCSDDPERDGKPALMVVTGTDPGGFFVTDLNACQQKEVLSSTGFTVNTPEPSGFLPGTYGSMYIYNYSYPEGLNEGDLLFSVAGAAQEFASTTQLVFPSWTIAERVRQLPPDQWNKWLQHAKVTDLNLRICGLDAAPPNPPGVGVTPFVTDVLCGHSRRNLKIESLESSLVRIRKVRFPEVWVDCDDDANFEVPFFCESRLSATGCNQACADPTPYCAPFAQQCVNYEWGFQDCGPEEGLQGSANDVAEMTCNVKCVVGEKGVPPQRCAERTTFAGFGQFPVELPPPGPAELGYDASLPGRTEAIALSGTPAAGATLYRAGVGVAVVCNTNAKVAFAPAGATNVAPTTPLLANAELRHVLGDAEQQAWVVADGAAGPNAKCWVSLDARTRIQVMTRDAVPELNPDCREDDPDAQKAAQCRAMRAASYDIVGHLRHVQPARPRWVVLPRNPDDLCCYPGPGLECPRPIQPCK